MRPILGILASLVLLCASAASGATLTTLYSFCAKAGCADGQGPLSGVIADPSGNLYGTTNYGGRYVTVSDGGTVFELVKSGSTWTHKVLHHFCAQPNCADGSRSVAGLIRDAAGNLYGTTIRGGANNEGVAFELSPKDGAWRLKVLYDFCAVGGAACADGAGPYAGLTYAGAASGAPYDGTSPLFGTTPGGGTGGGVVFQLTQVGGVWQEAVLHTFCTEAGCADGKSPLGVLLADGGGSLFGTTAEGNPANEGLVFELTKGSGDVWSETVLHSFCPLRHCTDAMDPATALIMDGTGALYGVGGNGGAHHSKGAVFKIVPDGAASQESVLHDFCALRKCADGAEPDTDLVMDSSGNLFGATSGGGRKGGVIFTLNGAYQIVYEFCSVKGCRDGSAPRGGLIMDGAGNLFGTTRLGGLHGGGGGESGTVYELMP